MFMADSGNRRMFEAEAGKRGVVSQIRGVYKAAS
jgi:hypothetical protein